MRNYYPLLVFVLICSATFAQTKTNLSVEKIGTVDITKNNPSWAASVQALEMPNPDGNSEKARVAQTKAEMELKYPRKTDGTNTIPTILQEKLDSLIDLNSFEGFEGNPYMNRVPNDNSLAISRQGILISAINSSFYVYDVANQTLLFNSFLQTVLPPPSTSASKYDPKLTYDPVADRFIMVFLIGTVHQNSKIAVCFSSSPSPLDPWHVYLVTGDALGTQHWTDYPAIAVGTEDLFLTGNLLVSNSSWQTGFYQSLIWQFDKQSGYNGDTILPTTIWSGIEDNGVKIRNIHPAKGARELAGPNQYFLSNKNFSVESDTVYMIEITNSQASGNAQLNLTRLSTPNHYFLSPSARQSISKTLATNDSRMLGVVIDDNVMQYVHNCMDTATGNAAIYHGKIENYATTPIISGRIIGHPIFDIGYPNIASTAIEADDLSCVIGFNFTSPTDTNGVAAIYMNNDGNYTEITKLKTGTAPVNILSGSEDRWGDYSGIQRHYSKSCEVWISGMYGKPGANGCWISSVNVGDTCAITPYFVSVEEQPKAEIKTHLYPNPSNEWVTLDFNLNESQMVQIELYSINGQLIDLLFHDKVKQGNNRLAFRVNDLPNGVYLVKIRSNNKFLHSDKVIVAH